MHHAVADRVRTAQLGNRAQPFDHRAHRLIVIVNRCAILRGITTGRLEAIAGVAADPIDQPAGQLALSGYRARRRVGLDQLKLEGRAATVENQDLHFARSW